jgi:hypothetical protein
MDLLFGRKKGREKARFAGENLTEDGFKKYDSLLTALQEDL